ncbi:MAG: phage tail protein [Clostridia bacterium]|jgi:phi13 family phage major tail protein|nr:phage tail protein [Clostridia bacterium]
MSKKKNKVRFGLKNCHYAKATFDEDGNVTYGTPVRLPGAVSLSLDPEGENENFYADDIVYYVLNNNAGYEGDLELALIPEEFLKDILHEEEDENGVLAENANNTFERFALLFEFTGDKKAIRHVLYCCSASRPSVEGETKEDEKEVQTEELSLIASALANGFVKAKTSTNTSKAVYDAWYDAVYIPAITETPDDEEEDGGDEQTGNDDQNAGG